MKTRKGFVSNSSSSSFIIINNESILPKGVRYVELNDEQKKRLIMDNKIRNLDDKVFLTEYISDDNDLVYENFNLCDDNGQMVKDEYDSPVRVERVIDYYDGGHGSPYNEEAFEEIGDSVWLLKGQWTNGFEIVDTESQTDIMLQEILDLVKEKKENEDS